MSTVLISAAQTSAEITLVAGDVVTLALGTPSSSNALPSGSGATISYKTAADGGTPIGALGLASPITVLSAPGTYIITKRPGTFTVERSDA